MSNKNPPSLQSVLAEFSSENNYFNLVEFHTFTLDTLRVQEHSGEPGIRFSNLSGQDQRRGIGYPAVRKNGNVYQTFVREKPDGTFEMFMQTWPTDDPYLAPRRTETRPITSVEFDDLWARARES